jgi:hypothetical protein
MGDTESAPSILSGGLTWQAVRYGLWHGTGYKVTLDFPNTLSNARSVLSATVPGATIGDAVVVTPPAAVSAQGGIYTAHIQAANLVYVYFNNTTTAAINPSSGSFTIATQ